MFISNWNIFCKQSLTLIKKIFKIKESCVPTPSNMYKHLQFLLFQENARRRCRRGRRDPYCRRAASWFLSSFCTYPRKKNPEDTGGGCVRDPFSIKLPNPRYFSIGVLRFTKPRPQPCSRWCAPFWFREVENVWN